MKLKRKLLLIVLLTAILSLFAMIILSNSIMIKNYYNLEKSVYDLEYNRIIEMINTEINHSSTILNDWAKWDDTYNFIESRNQDYIKSNITISTFQNLEIDFILLMDSNNQLVFYSEYDQVKNQVMYNQSSSIVKFSKMADLGSTLFYINDKPTIISKETVTDSNLMKPSNGTIIFGNYVDRNEFLIKKDDRPYQLNINMISTIHSEKKYILKQKDDTSILTFYIPYDNVNKGIEVNMIFKNSLTHLGKKNISFFITSFIVFTAVISILVVYVSNRYLFNRIENFSNIVEKIVSSEDLNYRFNAAANDEIGALAYNFNIMLKKIQKMNKKLYDHATYDELTGVYNRRIGFDKLETLMTENQEHHKDLSIVFVDINNLKTINDTLGHQVGDEVIVNLSKIIQEVLQEEEFIARLGGDEFLIVLPGSNTAEAKNTLDTVDMHIDKFNTINDYPYTLHISYGIESFDGKSSRKKFVERADTKMYEAKKRYKSTLS